jgi:hypothetical protein
LHRAQEVGLRIEPVGDKLLIRGPKRAESVVKLLAEHKAEVLAALTSDPSTSMCGDRYEAVNATQARGGATGSRPGSLIGFTVTVGGRRLGGLHGVTWRTNGTNATVSAGPPGNAQVATRQSEVRWR